MSLGLIGAWRLMNAKKKRCERCGLYYPKGSDKCLHCGDLNDRELKMLLESKAQESKGNASLGKYFLFLAVLIAALLFLTMV